MKNKKIIFIGQQDWDNEVGSNAINIAQILSKNNEVIYVNNALDRKTLKNKANDPKILKKKRILEGKEADIVEINQQLKIFYPKTILESINWLPVGFVYNILNNLNNKRLANEINRIVKKHNWNDYYIFNDCLISKTLYFKKYLTYTKYFYYIRDNFKPIPYFQKHAIAEQEKIMSYADAVFANSQFLADYAQKFNPKSFNIGQGCELDLYLKDNIEIADDIKNIKSPILGYTGYLTSMRLDIDLMVYIAKSKPDWNIVLVGPEDDKFKNSDLHKLSNVHFLGQKQPETMPNFIKAFDVCMNPQLINELTIGNYPRKIDEYLAMGKPTVATHTPFMDYFADATYLAKNKEEYISQIELAIAENNDFLVQKRIATAKDHSWESNVEKIYQIINQENL
ncbi:MAG: glycosyltransferase [Cytophagales bacterium]